MKITKRGTVTIDLEGELLFDGFSVDMEGENDDVNHTRLGRLLVEDVIAFLQKKIQPALENFKIEPSET